MADELNYNRESHLRWYLKNGKEYYKQYYKDNKAKINEYHKDYYNKNSDKLKKKQRAYHHANYFSKSQSYFKEHYFKHRLHLLETARRKREYGHGIVTINTNNKFIINFK